MKRLKIGIFGSAVNNVEDTLKKAIQLGNALGSKKTIVITGACEGLPYQAAMAAAREGAEVWEFSEYTSLKELRLANPSIDLSIYKKIIFVPKYFEFASNINICRKYRNVTSTSNCDAGLIISGRWGTLNEFTNLVDMGKIVGILTQTGGIADELKNLSKIIIKRPKAKIIFSLSPSQLVKKVIEKALKTR